MKLEVVPIKIIEPNISIVEDLKTLLQLAMVGELTGFACAYQFRDGGADTCFVIDPDGKIEVLIAHAGALHRALEMMIIPVGDDV